MKKEISYVKEIAITIGLIAAMISPGLIPVNAATPLPIVHGPLPITADSYPFGAADHTLIPTDLKKTGYVEEEFLVGGKANVYEWSEQGSAIVRTSNAPYTTGVLVRRPAVKSKFSGNVIVEMLNPSNMFDLSIGWAISHDQITRSGDAWAGITAKPVSIVSLKNFNRKRYADLSFANSTGESFCFIAGHEVPFNRAQLKKLYPNHKAYVDAVAKNLSSLISQRFVTKADAKKLLEEAKRAAIPKCAGQTKIRCG